MADKFFGEMITRSNAEPTGSRLEIKLSDGAGRSQTLTLSADAVATLSEILSEYSHSSSSRQHLTKIPQRYAVGHGRHEPLVLLRFEDEPAYGLSSAQALDLAEALIEEADATSEKRYLMRQ